jgi:hypothetical protein
MNEILTGMLKFPDTGKAYFLAAPWNLNLTTMAVPRLDKVAMICIDVPSDPSLRQFCRPWIFQVSVEIDSLGGECNIKMSLGTIM